MTGQLRLIRIQSTDTRLSLRETRKYSLAPIIHSIMTKMHTMPYPCTCHQLK